MLKICPTKIAIPLKLTFNKSLRQCKFPSDWKIAHVISILKQGDASLPSNYRPISLISCVGKIMERVIYKYVYNHLIKNKLIYEYQSGFLPKHSTVHHLLELYNSVLNAFEKKGFSCFLFVISPRHLTKFGIEVLSTRCSHTEYREIYCYGSKITYKGENKW